MTKNLQINKPYIVCAIVFHRNFAPLKLIIYNL